MLRLQPILSRVRTTGDVVTRCEFLGQTTLLLASTSVLGLAACGDGGSDPLLPDEGNGQPGTGDPNGDVDPGDAGGQTGGNNPPADDHPVDDPDVDEPPPGTEVMMSHDLKQVNGTQIVDDRAIIGKLNTNHNGLGDEPILLVRVDEDTVAANTIVCTHQQCNVAFNDRGEQLECPCHGSRYDLNGKVIQGPAPRALKHFKATIHGDSVFLE